VTALGSRRVIGPLSPPPSAFTADVEFVHPGGSAELRCRYERDGSMYAGGLRFERVRAYRFRAEGHCTPWHVEGSYETLVEIEGSDWIPELRAAEPPDAGGRWIIRHFLIYIDGAGAYEVAAEACDWLPEVAAA
jgi:hypothetical protein